MNCVAANEPCTNNDPIALANDRTIQSLFKFATISLNRASRFGLLEAIQVISATKQMVSDGTNYVLRLALKGHYDTTFICNATLHVATPVNITCEHLLHPLPELKKANCLPVFLQHYHSSKSNEYVFNYPLLSFDILKTILFFIKFYFYIYFNTAN